MLAKRHRLTEHEVSRVFKRGKPSFGQYWIATRYSSPFLQKHGVAISVSRKHDKRAVCRNALRRSVYDALREIVTESQARHYQFVLVLKKGLRIHDALLREQYAQEAVKILSSFTKVKPQYFEKSGISQ